MKHARSDYDCIQPWPTKRPHFARDEGGEKALVPDEIPDEDLEYMAAKGTIQPIIPDDEPVFLIRGQDLAAIPAAEAWCEAAAALGADADIIDAVRRHIEVVRDWQQTHAKVPDAPAEALR